MTWVSWSRDSDKSPGYFQYFTRGTAAEQMADAKAFAEGLSIDPDKGFSTIRTDGKDQRQSLIGKWISDGCLPEAGTVCGNWWCKLKHEFHMECERENAQ